MVSYSFLEVDENIVDKKIIREWLNLVVEKEGKVPGEIQFIFCTDDYLLKINQKYLNHDTLTDIITFPTSTNVEILSGDIYISAERIASNASQLNIPFDKELARVIVHGVLHLVGYKDKNTTEKTEMRSKEDYYLNLHPFNF